MLTLPASHVPHVHAAPLSRPSIRGAWNHAWSVGVVSERSTGADVCRNAATQATTRDCMIGRRSPGQLRLSLCTAEFHFTGFF